MRIKADAKTTGGDDLLNLARARPEVGGWVFCIDATFNCMTTRHYIFLLERKLFTCRYKNLLLEQIDARHHF